jgi:hexokinase
MNVTWVTDLPSGKEAGTFLTLDLGGTNLRVCWIALTSSKGEIKATQDQFKLPNDIKTGQADQLWDYVADSLQKFLEKHNLEGDDEHPIPLGFTFSYPATQDGIDHGVLQTWTKGFDIKGVEGEDVAQQLRDAIKKRVTCLFVKMEAPEC